MDYGDLTDAEVAAYRAAEAAASSEHERTWLDAKNARLGPLRQAVADADAAIDDRARRFREARAAGADANTMMLLEKERLELLIKREDALIALDEEIYTRQPPAEFPSPAEWIAQGGRAAPAPPAGRLPEGYEQDQCHVCGSDYTPYFDEDGEYKWSTCDTCNERSDLESEYYRLSAHATKQKALDHFTRAVRENPVENPRRNDPDFRIPDGVDEYNRSRTYGQRCYKEKQPDGRVLRVCGDAKFAAIDVIEDFRETAPQLYPTEAMRSEPSYMLTDAERERFFELQRLLAAPWPPEPAEERTT